MQSQVPNNNLTVVGTVPGSVDASGVWTPTAGGSSAGALPAAIVTGQKAVAVAGTAVAIGAGALVNGVAVTASLSNTAKVLIGPAGVTNVDTGAGNGYSLAPGQSISFAVGNLSAVFINSVAAGQYVTFAGN